MSSSEARYEGIANWYVEYTSDWEPEPLALLPDDIAGRRVLDLACAHGRATRFLARCGASVTAVDLSTTLITRARAIEADEPLGIEYLVGDASDAEWWDGTPFDGVVCNLALMDIDDLDAALTTVASVLSPGGWFTFSLFHPCYPGGWEGSPTGLASWPPDGGYAAEGWWQTNGVGVRGHVGRRIGCCRHTSTRCCALVSRSTSSWNRPCTSRCTSSPAAISRLFERLWPLWAPIDPTLNDRAGWAA